MGCQVLPPSSEICPGVPPTNSLFWFLGSTRNWLKYTGRWSWLLRNVQVAPPSSERNRPLALGSGGGWGPRPSPPRPPARGFSGPPAASVPPPTPALAPASTWAKITLGLGG